MRSLINKFSSASELFPNHKSEIINSSPGNPHPTQCIPTSNGRNQLGSYLVRLRPRRETLTNLRVGKARIDIRFYRQKHGDSDYEILDVRGPLHVLRQPSPWSLVATRGERIKDLLMSFLPGR